MEITEILSVLGISSIQPWPKKTIKHGIYAGDLFFSLTFMAVTKDKKDCPVMRIRIDTKPNLDNSGPVNPFHDSLMIIHQALL